MAAIVAGVALALTGCKSDGDTGPSPAPAPAGQGDLKSNLTPKQTVQSFRDVLRGEMVNTALFMLDEVDYGSQAAELIRVNIKKMSDDMVHRGLDFRPLEQELMHDCAAVIVRETGPNRNDLAVIYLIFRNNRWHISPQVWSYERMLNLDSGQRSRFSDLQRWYQIRRGELRALE